MKANNKKSVVKATLTMLINDGSTLETELSPAMLELLVKGSGISVQGAKGEGKIVCSKFDDATIREQVLPRLLKVELATNQKGIIND